jgi:hypothetical protein
MNLTQFPGVNRERRDPVRPYAEGCPDVAPFATTAAIDTLG